MEIFIAAVLGFILGIIFTRLATKKDGRLVISNGDFFVAITTKPEDLEKRKQIHLNVITK